MAYFQWADDMVIDNGPIDQDHQKLVHQINQLHTATSAGRGFFMVGRLLDELIRDTVAHTRQEEQMMAASGYPDHHLREHQQMHAHFIADLHRLQAKHASGHITVAAQLSLVLRDWLSLHIRRCDKEIRTFMRHKNRTLDSAALAC
ncbi:MAG: bacteriohemerythrin [Burkholderiaceae bacterium]|nr:bacteriohemerythrin [Burkholderiaceae bacterium]